MWSYDWNLSFPPHQFLSELWYNWMIDRSIVALYLEVNTSNIYNFEKQNRNQSSCDANSFNNMSHTRKRNKINLFGQYPTGNQCYWIWRRIISNTNNQLPFEGQSIGYLKALHKSIIHPFQSRSSRNIVRVNFCWGKENIFFFSISAQYRVCFDIAILCDITKKKKFCWGSQTQHFDRNEPGTIQYLNIAQ